MHRVNEKKRTDQLDRLIAKLAALTQEWQRERKFRREREDKKKSKP